MLAINKRNARNRSAILRIPNPTTPRNATKKKICRVARRTALYGELWSYKVLVLVLVLVLVYGVMVDSEDDLLLLLVQTRRVDFDGVVVVIDLEEVELDEDTKSC